MAHADVKCSACVTSILRTYYITKLTSSPDTSYMIMLTGRWTLAEMTVGIVISCSPVMPRFFRHFSSKAQEVFSWISNTSSWFRFRPSSTSKSRSKSPSEWPLGQDRSNDSPPVGQISSLGRQTRHHVTHVTLGSLDKFDQEIFGDGVMNQRYSALDEGPATKRQDLEAGLDPAWDKY